MRTAVLIIASISSLVFSEKPKTKQSLVGKSTFALAQKVIVQDTAKSNAVKKDNPMYAMAGFKRVFVGLAEIQLDTYKSGSEIEGEITLTSLQMPGLMGPVDKKVSNSFKLDNVRIDNDTLWFLFKTDNYSMPKKGFFTIFKGKKLLGISETQAYKVPCNDKLPGFYSINDKYLTLSESAPEYPIKKSRLTEFRTCLDEISDKEVLQYWKSEIGDFKAVIDSLL